MRHLICIIVCVLFMFVAVIAFAGQGPEYKFTLRCMAYTDDQGGEWEAAESVVYDKVNGQMIILKWPADTGVVQPAIGALPSVQDALDWEANTKPDKVKKKHAKYKNTGTALIEAFLEVYRDREGLTQKQMEDLLEPHIDPNKVKKEKDK